MDSFEIETRIRSLISEVLAPFLKKQSEEKKIIEKHAEAAATAREKIRDLEVRNFSVERKIETLEELDPRLEEVKKEIIELRASTLLKLETVESASQKSNHTLSEFRDEHQEVRSLISKIYELIEENEKNIKAYRESINKEIQSSIQENNKKINLIKGEKNEILHEMELLEGRIKEFSRTAIPNLTVKVHSFERQLKDLSKSIKSSLDLKASKQELIEVERERKSEHMKLETGLSIEVNNRKEFESKLESILPTFLYSEISQILYETFENKSIKKLMEFEEKTYKKTKEKLNCFEFHQNFDFIWETITARKESFKQRAIRKDTVKSIRQKQSLRSNTKSPVRPYSRGVTPRSDLNIPIKEESQGPIRIPVSSFKPLSPIPHEETSEIPRMPLIENPKRLTPINENTKSLPIAESPHRISVNSLRFSPGSEEPEKKYLENTEITSPPYNQQSLDEFPLPPLLEEEFSNPFEKLHTLEKDEIPIEEDFTEEEISEGSEESDTERMQNSINNLEEEIRTVQNSVEWVIHSLETLHKEFNSNKVNFSEELNSMITEVESKMTMLEEVYSTTCKIMQDEVFINGRKRKHDKEDLDALIMQMKDDLNIESVEIAKLWNEIEDWKISVDSVVESVKVVQLLLENDETDKESLELTGYRETSKKTSFIRSKQVVSLKPECLSCTGKNPTILSAFKMACLNYTPSVINFKNRMFERKDLIRLLGFALENGWNEEIIKLPQIESMETLVDTTHRPLSTRRTNRRSSHHILNLSATNRMLEPPEITPLSSQRIL